jgi:predicted enzyme related to lactoylglutathione lyase
VAKITVSGVTIDAVDPQGLAAWWGEALGWQVEGRSCRPEPGSDLRLEFMPGGTAKRDKNRVHIDFGAVDVQAAVDRLLAMGATLAWEEDFGPGSRYRNVVLRDPEGNEFCVGGPPGEAPPQ